MCLIRDLALALSACLYQALCSSDAWSLQQQQQEQQGSVGLLARLAVVFRAMHNIGVSNYSKREETQLEPGSSASKWQGNFPTEIVGTNLQLIVKHFLLTYRRYFTACLVGS
jgi:heme/copper-type cytochrome/quinol oxidase subunit 2